jgi:hypothetical protein
MIDVSAVSNAKNLQRDREYTADLAVEEAKVGRGEISKQQLDLWMELNKPTSGNIVALQNDREYWVLKAQKIIELSPQKYKYGIKNY